MFPHLQVGLGNLITNAAGVLLGWFFNSIFIGGLHCVFAVVTFLWLPKTPFELARKGKLEEFKESLAVIGNSKDEEFVLEQTEKEKEGLGFIDTLQVMNKHHLLVVLAVTVFSQVTGISIILAYMVDIFKQSSAMNPLCILQFHSLRLHLCVTLFLLF